jgi:hypothetical protein
VTGEEAVPARHPLRVDGRQAVVVALLALASLWQLPTIAKYTIIPWTKATWRTLDLNAMGRSARFYLGRAGAAYIDFLRSAVPEDSPIVIPPGAVQFSEQNILQFYLMPRAAVGCSCESEGEYSKACLDCIRAPNTFVPAIGEFPAPSAVAGVKVLVPFESKYPYYRGVFASAPLRDLISPGASSFDGLPLVPIALDILIIGLLLAVGSTVALGLLDQNSLRWVFPVAFPLGAGVVTWTVFLLGWAGWPLTVETFGAGVFLPLALASGYGWRTGHLARAWRAASRWYGRRSGFRITLSGSLLTLSLLTGVLFAGGAVSIGRGYSQFDDIANWALKGYGLAEEHSIFGGSMWGGNAMEYPENIPLQIAFFRLAEGDILPASKLTFTLFFASLVLGTLLFWGDSAVGKMVGALGALFLATVPILFEHATLGYANLPMTAYLVLGCMSSLSGFRKKDKGHVLIGSLLLGLSAWTRLESAVYALAAAVFLSAGMLRSREDRAYIPFLSLPMVTVMVPWLAFYGVYGGNGSPSEVAIARLIQEPGAGAGLLWQNSVELLRWLWLQAKDFPAWGAALPGSVALLLVGLPNAVKRRDRSVLLPVSLFGWVTLVVASIGIVGGDLSGWQTELYRHLFPVVTLAIVASVVAAGRWIGASSPGTLSRVLGDRGAPRNAPYIGQGGSHE